MSRSTGSVRAHLGNPGLKSLNRSSERRRWRAIGCAFVRERSGKPTATITSCVPWNNCVPIASPSHATLLFDRQCIRRPKRPGPERPRPERPGPACCTRNCNGCRNQCLPAGRRQPALAFRPNPEKEEHLVLTIALASTGRASKQNSFPFQRKPIIRLTSSGKCCHWSTFLAMSPSLVQGSD